MQRCCVCFRTVGNGDDFVLAAEMERVPFCNVKCHFICWNIRRNASDELFTEIATTAKRVWKSKAEHAKDCADLGACSLCSKPLCDSASGDAIVCFSGCGHAASHMRCMQLMGNLNRRMGCPICQDTKEKDDARYLHWARLPQLQKTKYVAISPAQAGASASASSTPVTVTQIVTTAAQATAAAQNERIGYMMTYGRVASEIAAVYSSSMLHMIEPVYPSPARKLAFEMNHEVVDNAVVHLTEGFPSVIDFMADKRYAAHDMLELGLTFEILAACEKDREHMSNGSFTWKQLGAMGATLLSLAMLGVNVNHMSRLLPDVADLASLRFNVSVFIAAGGTHDNYTKMQEHIGFGQHIKLAGENPLPTPEHDVLAKWRVALF